jgi:AraC-like DNA-binding protein
MNMSERTLQRRLKNDGIAFHKLVDDVRYGLLDLYLTNPAYPLKEIATLLGFADQSSFTRAVQRWHGITPGKLRQKRLATLAQ